MTPSASRPFRPQAASRTRAQHLGKDVGADSSPNFWKRPPERPKHGSGSALGQEQAAESARRARLPVAAEAERGEEKVAERQAATKPKSLSGAARSEQAAERAAEVHASVAAAAAEQDGEAALVTAVAAPVSSRTSHSRQPFVQPGAPPADLDVAPACAPAARCLRA